MPAVQFVDVNVADQIVVAIQQNGMRQDFSWDVSAREYVKVYRGA